jgi:hypothetical protein
MVPRPLIQDQQGRLAVQRQGPVVEIHAPDAAPGPVDQHGLGVHHAYLVLEHAHAERQLAERYARLLRLPVAFVYRPRLSGEWVTGEV